MFSKEEAEKKARLYHETAPWRADPETLIALLKLEPPAFRLNKLLSSRLNSSRYLYVCMVEGCVVHELCGIYLHSDNKEVREKHGVYLQELLTLLSPEEAKYAITCRADLRHYFSGIEIALTRFNVGLAKLLLKFIPEAERLQLVMDANEIHCARQDFWCGSTRVKAFIRFEEQLEKEGILPKVTSEQKKAIKKEVNKACVVARTCDVCTLF